MKNVKFMYMCEIKFKQCYMGFVQVATTLNNGKTI